MKKLHELLQTAKKTYDSGTNCPEDLKRVVRCAHELLKEKATSDCLDTIQDKTYHVFRCTNDLSRPYLPDLFLTDVRTFESKWDELVKNIRGRTFCVCLDEKTINQVLYTAIMSVSAAYDLWKPGSRKTPGTFFELLLGTILGKALPDFSREKSISIPNEKEKISTDIVFVRRSDGAFRGLVVPAKITTRERVVQPYAHQRILNSVFGEQAFKSVLLCVSETQRAGNSEANEICVPGTIKLYQKHLARIEGIYYLDPPLRYLKKDLTNEIWISSIGDLLRNRLPSLLKPQGN